MKKVVSFMIVVFLLMSVSVTDTYAWGNSYKNLTCGLSKNKVVTVRIEKKFRDIIGYDWAEKAIEKMAIKGVIKGYGEGIYKPKRSVTKLEAIIMALRVMGYEEQAKMDLERIRRGSKKLKNKNRIDAWAYGYVAVALEKGILDEVDLIDMNLKEPAKRHEVAKYIIRALDYEREAQKYMKKELRFIDAGAVPLGSVGYVYLADKKGIISGYPDKTFRPNRPVTRAEMAVLIARLDDKVDNDIDENEELAEIVKISNGKLTLKNNDGTKTYRVLKNAPVYTEDGEYTSIDELQRGMKIKVQLNESRVIIFIEIKEHDESFREYIGTVEEIDDDEIEIKVNGRERDFDIEDDDIEVQFNDKKGDIEDIREGDKVKVRVNEDQEVEYIRVYRQLGIKEYGGIVEEIDDDEIEIKVNGVKRDFDIEDDDIEVQFNDKKGNIEDIREGDKAKIRVNRDEEVEYIRVYTQLGKREYIGIVEEIDDDEIEITVNGIKRDFDIEDDIEVQFNDKKGSIGDIREGDKVKIRVNRDEEVEYIRVYGELGEDEYKGEVEEIDDDEITIEVNKEEITFDIKDDVEIEFENGKGRIEDIKEGYEVKIRVNEDEEVEYIKVYESLDYDAYEGLFIEIDSNKMSVIVSKEIMEFEVDSDMVVKFEDKEGDIEDLIVGDEVKVVTKEDDDEVRWIEVDRNRNTEIVNGNLIKLYEDEKQIAIKEDGKIEIYDYKSTTDVFINDDDADLSELEEDDNVRLILDDDKVTEIRAYRLVIVD